MFVLYMLVNNVYQKIIFIKSCVKNKREEEEEEETNTKRKL